MIDFSNPVLLAILSSLVIIGLIILENKVNNSIKSNKEYLKLFFIVFTITLILLFIHETAIFRNNNVEIYEGTPNF